jgi:Tfp pilus assembly protein PilF
VAFTVVGCVSPIAHWWTNSSDPKVKLKDPAKVYSTWGKLQEQYGNPTEARAAYETVLREEPKSVEAIMGMARLDEMAGKHAEAESGFLKALSLRPKDPHVMDAVGQFYASRSNWRKSVEYLTAANKANPDEKLFRHHLAVALANSGDVDAALPLFAQCVGDAAAHYNIGVILHQQGQTAASERHLRQALALKPDFEEAKFWLGEVTGGTSNEVVMVRGTADTPAVNPAVDRAVAAARPEAAGPSAGTSSGANPFEFSAGFASPTERSMLPQVSPSAVASTPSAVPREERPNPFQAPSTPSRPNPFAAAPASAGHTRATATPSAQQSLPWPTSGVQREQFENSLIPSQREQWQNQKPY